MQPEQHGHRHCYDEGINGKIGDSSNKVSDIFAMTGSRYRFIPTVPCRRTEEECFEKNASHIEQSDCHHGIASIAELLVRKYDCIK